MLNKSNRIQLITQSTPTSIMDILHIISDVDELEMALLINPNIIQYVRNQIPFHSDMPLDLIEQDVYTTESLINYYILTWNSTVEEKLMRDNVPLTLKYSDKNIELIEHLSTIQYPSVILTALICEAEYLSNTYPSMKIMIRELASTYQLLVQYRRYDIMPSKNIIVGSKTIKKYPNLTEDIEETCKLYPDCSQLLDRFPSIKKLIQ